MKNECSYVRDILPLYYEGMVSEETAEFVKQHLETCDECRKSLDEMKSLNSVKGFLFSSSGFTHTSKRFAENRPIELLEKDKLEKYLSIAGRK